MSEIESTQDGPFFVITEQVTYQRVAPDNEIYFPHPRLSKSDPIEVERRPFNNDELQKVIKDINEELEWRESDPNYLDTDAAEQRARKGYKTDYLMQIGMTSGMLEVLGVVLLTDELVGFKVVGFGSVALGIASVVWSRGPYHKTSDRRASEARQKIEANVAQYNQLASLRETAKAQFDSQESTTSGSEQI